MVQSVSKLDPLFVRRQDKPGKYGDGLGLYLVVTRTGAKSWAFRYMRQGRAHEMGLGGTHTLSLAEARERARSLRQQLLDGLDPLAQRHAARPSEGAVTFAVAADLYFAAHAPAWRSAIYRRQWRSSMRDYILPRIGPMPVTAIDTNAVLAVVSPLWKDKTATASRARQRIEVVLDYCTARGWRTGENPARWRRHLDKLLPSQSRIAPPKHHAAMQWSAVPAFVAELLQRRHGASARALHLLVLTAVRSGEARGMRWSEVDFDRALWVIPASRMKGGKDHRVPLVPAAMQILRNQFSEAEPIGELVFSGQTGGQLSDRSLSRILPPGVTVHGFRAAFRTWAGERTAFSRETVELALAHKIGNAVEQAYSRGDQLAKRRELMTAWAEHCAAPRSEVIQFRPATGAA